MAGSEPRAEACPKHGGDLATAFLIRRARPALGHLSGWTGCPACAQESAEQASKAEQARLAGERRQSAQRSLEQRLAGAMIPPRFRSKTFANYLAKSEEQQRALADLKAYADDFGQVLFDGRCLLLVGRTGTGKTHLSCAVANAIMGQGYTALFRTVQEVIRHVRGSWRQGGSGGRSEDEAIAELVAPDLLILDEVGVQYGKDAELVTLFDVMNARYSACKPSIVLSNLALGEVKQFLGERVFDRLRENGGKAIPFEWESCR